MEGIVPKLVLQTIEGKSTPKQSINSCGTGSKGPGETWLEKPLPHTLNLLVSWSVFD
jgi:hypothetical protein